MNFVPDLSADIDRTHRIADLPRAVTHCRLVQTFGKPAPHGMGWIFRADDGRVFTVYGVGEYRVGGRTGPHEDFKSWLLTRLKENPTP